MMSVRQLASAALFTALISIGSRIMIPLDMIGMHYTLQWLFVLLAGLLLDEKTARMSVGCYLLIGLIGMPVFAAGGGIGYLFKPTFGFLAGFFVAVCLMGVMKTGPLMKCTAGLLADYLTGFFWYLFMMYAVYQQPLGMIAAFINCFTTIIPDYLLCLCACAIARRLAPVVRHG